jgi:hypothetical protein
MLATKAFYLLRLKTVKSRPLLLFPYNNKRPTILILRVYCRHCDQLHVMGSLKPSLVWMNKERFKEVERQKGVPGLKVDACSLCSTLTLRKSGKPPVL